MRKRGFEELYSSLSPFIKISLAYGENYSKAVTSGMFENFSHSVNNSISNTTGKNSSTSSSHTHGTNSGSSIGGVGDSALIPEPLIVQQADIHQVLHGQNL